MNDRDNVWSVGRWAGLVTLAGVMAWAFGLAILGTDRQAFSTVARWSGSVASRVVLSLVVFAAALHLVDGIGRLLRSAQPERWRAAAWFVAFATGLPAASVLLWPFVEGRV